MALSARDSQCWRKKKKSPGSVQNLSQLEGEVWNVASASEKSGKKDEVRPWEIDELRELRVQRRIALDPSDRKRLSKQIWRLTRNELRKYRTKKAEDKLIEFSSLEALKKLHLCPIQKTHTIGPDLQACANLLQQVYTSDHETKYAEGFTVPLFTIQELHYSLKHMRKGRCADSDGIVLEMFLYGGEFNQERLLECLNKVLLEGEIPSSWCNIVSHYCIKEDQFKTQIIGDQLQF